MIRLTAQFLKVLVLREGFLELDDQVDGSVPKSVGDVQLNQSGLDTQILEDDRDRNGRNLADLSRNLGMGVQVEDDPITRWG